MSASAKDISRNTALNAPSFLSRFAGNNRLVTISFLLPALALLLLLFVYPVATFLLKSLFDPNFTLAYYQKAISSPLIWRVLKETFLISSLTTVICLFLGYPVALTMVMVPERFRTLLFAIVVIPFWTNVLVRVYAWLVLMGNAGVINNALLGAGLIDDPYRMLFSKFGVVVAMVHVMLPYMIFPAYSVMSGIPKEYARASANLGASTFQSWWHIYLPLSLPGIGAGCLLVFIMSLGFWIVPALLGSPSETMLSQVIEQQISEVFEWGFAAALSTILLVITIALYTIYNRLISVETIYEGGAPK